MGNLLDILIASFVIYHRKIHDSCSDLPRIVDAFLFKLEYETARENIIVSLGRTQAACEALRSSEYLHRTLSMVS